MKICLILLFALISAALCAQFTVPLRKAGNVREKAIREGRHKQWIAETKTQQLQSGGELLKDVVDDYYMMVISMGTPWQDLLVALETTSSDLYVLDSNHTKAVCPGDVEPAKSLYNSSDSTSFIGGGRSAAFPYGGFTLEGTLGKDRLTFAGFTFTNQDFGDATKSPCVFNMQPSVGTFGLGFPARAQYGTKSVIQNLLPMLDAPVILIWMERLNTVQGDLAGYAGFGQTENTGCENITYVPLSGDKDAWKFNINGVAIGSYSRVKTEVAMTAIGTGWTGVPPVVFSAIVKQTRAVYDWTYEIYTVQCSTIPTLPDLTLIINGNQYAVKAENYIVDLNLGGGRCALAFFQSGSRGEATWYLGDAFGRTYCQFFDYGKARLGLAKSNHPVA